MAKPPAKDQWVELEQRVQAMLPMPPNEWEAFAAIWQPFTARRKAVLTPAGTTERYLYFVTQGVQRAYFETADGRQATILFTYPYSFSGLLDSFLLQKPSGFTLETLTQSQFLRCHYAAFSTLQVQYPAIMQMVLAGTAHAMSGVLDRLAQIQCYTAQEKFKALLTRSPHVLNLIPHKYLANYLGIDPATFSKLLAAVRL